MVHIRYNPNKANTTEMAHSTVNDINETIQVLDCCCSNVCVPAINSISHDYNKGNYGCCLFKSSLCFIGSVTITIVTIALTIISSTQSDRSAWEVCSYDSNGWGLCWDLFKD